MAYLQILHAYRNNVCIAHVRGRARMRIIPRFIAFAHNSSISYLDIANEPVIDVNSGIFTENCLDFLYYEGRRRLADYHIE